MLPTTHLGQPRLLLGDSRIAATRPVAGYNVRRGPGRSQQMKIAVLGTGVVGRTIASKLVAVGHEVRMGSRTADNAVAVEWASQAGELASCGTFSDAAAFAEAVFGCAKGLHALDVLRAAGSEHLDGKILVDLANPLDFSGGFPPTLSICNGDSLGETIQREFPGAKVVKTLNTMSCSLMVDPGALSGDHDVFVSGDDEGAKQAVVGWLKQWFGWADPIDLGDITTARGTEAWLLLWTRLYGRFGHADFNLSIVRK
jgi:8-hydroxy-5-deazaflavin:NADPH oxidoreductase